MNERTDLTNNFLIAINKYDGETIWQVSRDEFTRGYSTPTVWYSSNGKPQVIVAGSLQLASYDIDSGAKLWWVNGLARIVVTTPVITDDRIFAATWSPGGDPGQRIGMERWDQAADNYDKNKDGLIVREELTEGPVLTRFFRIDLK